MKRAVSPMRVYPTKSSTGSRRSLSSHWKARSSRWKRFKACVTELDLSVVRQLSPAIHRDGRQRSRQPVRRSTRWAQGRGAHLGASRRLVARRPGEAGPYAHGLNHRRLGGAGLVAPSPTCKRLACCASPKNRPGPLKRLRFGQSLERPCRPCSGDRSEYQSYHP